MNHLLTFDLEHWYLGYLYRGGRGWECYPARDHIVVERLLRLLDDFGFKATFFTTGAFINEFPTLLKDIVSNGHEVASHSFDHTLVSDFPDFIAFQEDLHRSVSTIEDILGTQVFGFRAPKWSFPTNPDLFYETLSHEGLVYDSSLFPNLFSSKMPNDPFVKELTSGKRIWEFPATVLNIANLHIPASGGLWLRLFPQFISKQALRQGENNGVPRMVYLHPYDLDPECPRLFSFLSLGTLPFMIARYYGLRRTETILRELFLNFRFSSIQEWLKAEQENPSSAVAGPFLPA